MTDKQFVAKCSQLKMPGLGKRYRGWPGEQRPRHLEFNLSNLFAACGELLSRNLALAPREAAAILRDWMLPRVFANTNADTVANILSHDTNARLLGEWKRFCTGETP